MSDLISFFFFFLSDLISKHLVSAHTVTQEIHNNKKFCDCIPKSAHGVAILFCLEAEVVGLFLEKDALKRRAKFLAESNLQQSHSRIGKGVSEKIDKHLSRK